MSLDEWTNFHWWKKEFHNWRGWFQCQCTREREREKELLWSMIDRISSRRLLFENNSLCLFEISDKSSSWRCKNVPIFVYHPRSIAFYTFEISRTKLLPKKCTISSVNTVRFVKFVLVILLIREVGQGLLFIVRSFTFSNRYGIRGLWRHLRCEKCLRSFVGFQRLQSLFGCLVLSSEQSIRKNQLRQRKGEISQSSSQIRIEYIIEISSFFLCCVYSCTEMSNSCSVHWINVKEKGDQSSDDDDLIEWQEEICWSTWMGIGFVRRNIFLRKGVYRLGRWKLISNNTTKDFLLWYREIYCTRLLAFFNHLEMFSKICIRLIAASQSITSTRYRMKAFECSLEFFRTDFFFFIVVGASSLYDCDYYW